MKITMPHGRNSVLACLGLALLLAACQPAPTTGTGGTRDIDRETQAAVDPCALRLQNIGGAMLQSYLKNKQLPETLSDLQPMADIDTPLDFTCPVSHNSYNYYPGGLASPDQEKMIFVADPSPSHTGPKKVPSRWCLLISPIRPGASISTEVLLIPEQAFRRYQPPFGQ